MLAPFLLSLGLPQFLKFNVSPYFPSGLDELIAALLYFTWFYFELINQVYITMRNRNSVVQIKNDRFSLLVIYIGILGMSYVAGWFASLRLSSNIGALPSWFFWVGIAVMVTGELIRQWSIYTLGRFFTWPVMIAKDHRLIVKGPYKYIRHPSYLGGILTFSGLALALQSWIAPIVVVGILLLTYSYRIHVEEQALARKFGKEYKDYANRTSMIIPRIL